MWHSKLQMMKREFWLEEILVFVKRLTICKSGSVNLKEATQGNFR
jgi:hypothetical protein